MRGRRLLSVLAVVATVPMSGCGNADSDRIAELEDRLAQAQSSLSAAPTPESRTPEEIAAEVDADPAYQAVDDTPDYFDTTTPGAALTTYFRLIGDARFEDACGLVDQTLKAYWYTKYQVDCVVYLATAFSPEDQEEIRTEGFTVDPTRIEVSGPIASLESDVIDGMSDGATKGLGLRQSGSNWSLTYVGPSPNSR